MDVCTGQTPLEIAFPSEHHEREVRPFDRYGCASIASMLISY